MKISGAKAIVECLLEQGVDTVFGYPGGTILPLYDALLDSPLRHILTVHEQGAAHAADGYARATGRVGVCIATSGPGATNLVTGLATAYMDSVPIVALTGQVPTMLIGRDAFQEVDITGITMPITKHNFQVKDPNRLTEILRYAFKIARSGRPGPVLVDIPRDVQTALIDFRPQSGGGEQENRISLYTSNLLVKAAEAIEKSKQPVMIVGGGAVAAEVHEEVLALAEKRSLPVVSTLMGLGAFPAVHHQFLGLSGLHGQKVANNAICAADVIIAVGSRFNDRMTGDRGQYSTGKTVIHIDVDPAEIDKNVAAHIGLAGDLKKLLPLLTNSVKPGKNEKWWDTIKGWQQQFDVGYESNQLTAPWIMNQIAEMTDGQPYVYVTDVGQHQMWAAQHLKINVPRTWLTSGGLGAMGFGLPAAMGAQLALPNKRVIHIAGDGGLKMTGNELYTIASYHLPIISVIINNSGLGMVRQLQNVFFNKRHSASNLPHRFDFTGYVQSFGIHAAEANTPEEFEKVFAAAKESQNPEVIIANISPEEMVKPMVRAALNDYFEDI